MGKIKIACETYTWQMPGESYKGKLDHIMGVISAAGFAGIEPETSFFGDLSDPLKMKDTLAKHNLEFAVLVHVEDWRNPKETDSERTRSEQWIRISILFSRCDLFACTNAWSGPESFTGATKKFIKLCECTC